MNRLWIGLTGAHLALSFFGGTADAAIAIEGIHTRVTTSPVTGRITEYFRPSFGLLSP